MPVIAMTREIGTSGSEVARGLADRLGLEIVGHEIVEHDLAAMTGLAEDRVYRILEGMAALPGRWTADRRRFCDCRALEILELAARGNVLIRGWGATNLLKGVPHVLCVRICAPMWLREKALGEQADPGPESDRRRCLVRTDTAHNGTMAGPFKSHWDDAANYAIVLNTVRVPVADCVEQIASLAQSAAFRETTASRAVLFDQLILYRVKYALEQCLNSGSLQYKISPEVVGGKVVLTGATIDGRMIADAVRLARAVEGVTGVENKVQLLNVMPYVF